MWSPVKIEFSNLYSHAHTQYSFSHNQLTQIRGINLDDDGADSNGAGKSTLIEAITLAILGYTYRNTSKDEFIRNGERECYVEMELFNMFLVRKMVIKRWFYRGDKSAKGELWIDDVQKKDITNHNGDTLTKHVLSQIGISADDLENYYIIGQGNRHSFLSSTDTEQKKIISRFSNFEMIDRVHASVQKELGEQEVIMRELSDKLQKIQGRIDVYEEQLAKEEEAWQEKQDVKIQEAETEYLRYKKLVAAKEQEQQEIVNEKLRLTTQWEQLAGTEKADGMVDLKEKLRKSREAQKSNEDELRKQKKRIQHLQLQIDGAVTCPDCGNVFTVGSDLTIPEAKVELQKSRLLVNNLTTEIEAQEEGIVILTDRIQTAEENTRKIARVATRISETGKEIETLNLTIQKYKRKRKEAKLLLDDLKNQKFISGQSGQEKALEDEKHRYSALEVRTSAAQKEIDRLNFFAYHFGKAGLKTHLSNKTIKNIEDITNFYLNKFETNLNVRIEGYKVLKSGDVREKINIFIVRNGLEEGNFFKFSGGERSRIDICSIIALQRLINNSCSSGGLNLLALDEYVTGLDGKGQEAAIHILKQASITTLLVLHHTTSSEGIVVTFEKKDKISRLKSIQ